MTKADNSADAAVFRALDTIERGGIDYDGPQRGRPTRAEIEDAKRILRDWQNRARKDKP